MSEIYQPNEIDHRLYELARTITERVTSTDPLPPAEPEESAGRLAMAIEEAEDRSRLESRIRATHRLRAVLAGGSRLGVGAHRVRDPEMLARGLILIGFGDDGADWRDLMLAVAPFHIEANALGTDPAALFARAAACAPLPETARTFLVFGPRTDIHRGRNWLDFASILARHGAG